VRTSVVESALAALVTQLTGEIRDFAAARPDAEIEIGWHEIGSEAAGADGEGEPG
jgi:hypothetical protein